MRGARLGVSGRTSGRQGDHVNPAEFVAREAMVKFFAMDETKGQVQMTDTDWHGLFMAFLRAVYTKEDMPTPEQLVALMTHLMAHILMTRPGLRDMADLATGSVN